jgi:hypothetical protein
MKATVPVPVPDERQVSAFKRYLAEYIIMGLTAAVVAQFFMIRDLNRDIINLLMKQGTESNNVNIEARKAISDFLNYQRFGWPIRRPELFLEPGDSSVKK